MTALRSSTPRRGRHGDLKGEAYRQLKQLILLGELPGGEFLSERQLAERLGMSKTPVKFALERLELEGLVRVSPQRGIIIREPTVEEITDQFEIRLALEGYACQTLAGQLTPEQVEEIEENLRAQEQAAEEEDLPRTVRLDTEFHLLFAEFLGNREILSTLERLRDRTGALILRVYQQSGRPRLQSSFEEHRGLARAVISGKPELALKRLDRHFEYGKKLLLSPRR